MKPLSRTTKPATEPETPAPEVPGAPTAPAVLAPARCSRVWAAAAVPMAVLAWVVAPAVAGDGASKDRFFVTLLSALTFGLLWQAVLVAVLVLRERSVDPSWTNVRDRLWLRAPHTATRRGGRLWWWVLAYALALAALDMAPFGPMPPDDRSFGVFLGSDAGQASVPPQLVAVRAVRVRALHSTPSWARSCSSGACCSPGCGVPSAGPTGSSTACCSASTTCTSRGSSRTPSSPGSCAPDRPRGTAAR